MFPDEVTAFGQVYIPRSETPELVQYYRVPHDIERVNVNADNFKYAGNRSGRVRQAVLDKGEALPEVYRLNPNHHTVLSCPYQWMWKNINPNLSPQKWATLMGNQLMLMNHPADEQFYNCVTGEGAGEPFPRFDQPRVCGGAILAGIEELGKLWIDSMVITQPVKPWGNVLDNPAWWYWATSINPRGEINLITREGMDGNRYPVRIPVLTHYSVWLPLDELHKLPLGFVPHDARWIP